MARGGRLPRTAGRPPRFLRTGPSARYQPERGTSFRPRGGTPDTRSGVRPRVSFNRFCSIGHRGACERKGDIPRPGRARPRRRRDAHFRGGLPAAEVADAAPATAPRPEGRAARLPRCPHCPGCSSQATTGEVAAPSQMEQSAEVRFGRSRLVRSGRRDQRRCWPPLAEGKRASRTCRSVHASRASKGRLRHRSPSPRQRETRSRACRPSGLGRHGSRRFSVGAGLIPQPPTDAR
jgi:hypothetical protein